MLNSPATLLMSLTLRNSRHGEQFNLKLKTVKKVCGKSRNVLRRRLPPQVLSSQEKSLKSIQVTRSLLKTQPKTRFSESFWQIFVLLLLETQEREKLISLLHSKPKNSLERMLLARKSRYKSSSQERLRSRVKAIRKKTKLLLLPQFSYQTRRISLSLSLKMVWLLSQTQDKMKTSQPSSKSSKLLKKLAELPRLACTLEVLHTTFRSILITHNLKWEANQSNFSSSQRTILDLPVLLRLC
mmetsp:Transcript_82165/g.96090  ORF Transcript_82165/g.96090 Transcript_82165/m.96090 type:complete len:241 (+) Transcript_82165:811-1533(+)